MPKGCEGKVALVAGASQMGTGTGTVVRLAAEGAKVAFCARDEAMMAKTAEMVEEVGGKSVHMRCDLSDPDGGRDTLIARTEAAFGPIDYLVYVATRGGFPKFETVTQARLQVALELNGKAPWLLCQQAVESMRRRESGGAIVNIGTKAAYPIEGSIFGATTNHSAATLYGGTKALLHRFTQGLAVECYEDGISVNVLRPLAAIDTRAVRETPWISPEVIEPRETMVEAVIALLTGDPKVLTGRDVASIDLLIELQRPVYDFAGTQLVPGWQPEDLPTYVAGNEKS
jgi:NAD(P)-dependent dehydrogenase (short-subunit alcohol dehydrogenase family)